MFTGEQITQTLLHDLRYSMRQLAKSPGFTFTAVVSLALGIAATTAAFSAIYAALISPYPYSAADRIVRLTMQTKTGAGQWINLNGSQIQQVQRVPVVETVIAMDWRPSRNGNKSILRHGFSASLRPSASNSLSVCGGILAELVFSLALNRIIESWAHGSNSGDPPVLLAGVLLLFLVAGIASAIPAQRAVRVDLVTALRCD